MQFGRPETQLMIRDVVRAGSEVACGCDCISGGETPKLVGGLLGSRLSTPVDRFLKESRTFRG